MSHASPPMPVDWSLRERCCLSIGKEMLNQVAMYDQEDMVCNIKVQIWGEVVEKRQSQEQEGRDGISRACEIENEESANEEGKCKQVVITMELPLEEEREVKDVGAAEKKEKKSEDKSADAGEQGLSGQSRADGKSGVAREVVESSEQSWWKTFWSRWW